MIRQVTQDRNHLLLWIDRTVFVYIPIQVDREAGDGDNGFLEVNQQRETLTRSLRAGDASCDREIPIKPGCEQHTSVDLDTKLMKPGPSYIRRRFDAKTGAVGMGADHAHAGFNERRASHSKCDER